MLQGKAYQYRKLTYNVWGKFYADPLELMSEEANGQQVHSRL